MGSRQPGAMVAMSTTCPFSGSRRSGLMWMPGPIASLSSGIWSMLTVSRSLGRHAAATLPCSTSPTGDQRRAGVDLGRCRDDRPYRAPTAAAVGARSARLGNLLGGTRPAGDDVGDDVPGGAGAQTHEHQRVYPSCGSATPVAVRIIPGETGADMCRNLSECVRIYGYE